MTAYHSKECFLGSLDLSEHFYGFFITGFGGFSLEFEDLTPELKEDIGLFCHSSLPIMLYWKDRSRWGKNQVKLLIIYAELSRVTRIHGMLRNE